MVGITSAALAAVVGVALTQGADGPGDRVQVRASAPTTDEATSAAPITEMVSTSTTTTPLAPAPVTVAPAAPPPWSADPTAGLTNLAPVTITAHDLPDGLYIVGQCPSDVGVPDEAHCAINGRPNFISVHDGTLRSTVRVYRWVGKPHFDCASAPGACAVGFIRNVPASGFDPVGFPISFDPARAPRIVASPTDALTDGQTIEVRGVDVGDGDVVVEQCLLVSWAACAFHHVSGEPDGTFGISFPVWRVISWGGHGAGTGTCGVDADCAITVTVHPYADANDVTWSNSATPIVLHFAPLPPSSTTTTSAAVSAPA